MEHSPTLDKLATALSAAQADIKGAPKSSDNPFFKSKYADLAEVWDACRPQLTAHGLSVVQFPAMTDDGRVALRTILLHASGEFLSDVFSLAPSKHDPQGIGSALTYMRRYALSAVAGVPQVDDDGNAASGRNGGDSGIKPPQQKPKPAEPVNVATGEVPTLFIRKVYRMITGKREHWALDLSDGRVVGTLDDSIARQAEAFAAEAVPVDIILGPGKAMPSVQEIARAA